MTHVSQVRHPSSFFLIVSHYLRIVSVFFIKGSFLEKIYVS